MVSLRICAALAAASYLAGPAATLAQDAAKPAAAPASQKSPRPVEDFAALPFIESPSLSPDGKLIAGKIAVDGKQFFAIMALNGDKPRFVGLGKLDLNWWRWVNNEWLVIGYGQSQPVQGEDWYFQRALGVRADGTKLVPLAKDAAQDGDDIIWVANDGTPRILLAAQKSAFADEIGFWPSVSEYDVSTGKAKTVVQSREGVRQWVADSNGMVRMGYAMSMDGRERRVLYRGPTGGSFKEIARTKRNEEGGHVLPALFLSDPDKAITYADDDKGYGGIYEFDLTTLSRGKLLYASKGFDIGAITPTRRGNAIAGIDYNEQASRTEWIDPELVKIQARVAGLVKGGSATIVSYSDDYNKVIVFIGGADTPGAYYVYSRDADDIQLLAKRNNLIGGARLNPVKTIRYQARDGLEIHAILTLPRGRAAKDLPLIVYPHGGPGARDDESWDFWAQFLASRGYAVIQPNYRGSTGYGTEFTQRGRGEWGLKMQDDLNDAVTWLAKEGIADPKRVCITGGSYGGYAAMRAAQRDGKIYRCAVSFAGVSDLGRMKRYDSRFLGGEATGDWLKKQAPDFAAVSPLNGAAQFTIPILLVHGKDDVVVPYAQSRDMAERLKAAGKPVTFIGQPLGDHHFSRYADRLQFLQAMEAFLREHNPA